MPPGTSELFSFPAPAEAGWYFFLRLIERWAERLPEEDVIERTSRLATHVAGLAGRPAAPFVAMGRGLAVTVLFRSRRVSILDRLDEASRRKWEEFRREASDVARAVFVSAHLGPFQLQMDILAPLPHDILFLYKSYRWAPLARRVVPLRLESPRFRYVDMNQPRRVAEALGNGHSLAFLGDVSFSSAASARRLIPLYGRPRLEDFPVRVVLRKKWPLFVGGLFHRPGPARRGPALFGFDYVRIVPADAPSTLRAYTAAMERTIRNNPADWVRFEAP